MQLGTRRGCPNDSPQRFDRFGVAGIGRPDEGIVVTERIEMPVAPNEVGGFQIAVYESGAFQRLFEQIEGGQQGGAPFGMQSL
ncbi:MAG: hypothetical protein NC250_02680 [Alistipes senegalensis]|nr:hypothetical protein [Bacteroides cellulosilyticus]MCM1351623.1 hypothetical protein [Alistipes senegalensis]